VNNKRKFEEIRSVPKGVGRKICREGGIARKTKNSTIKPLPGVRETEKRPKNSTIKLYLLYLYHVWKSSDGHRPLPPLPPRCRR